MIGDDRERVDGVIRGEGLVIRFRGDHANFAHSIPTSTANCDLDSREVSKRVDGVGKVGVHDNCQSAGQKGGSLGRRDGSRMNWPAAWK